MTSFTLSLDQLFDLHAASIRLHGGSGGLRDRGLVESALSQPFATFGGVELYPTVPEKASALAFSLAKNHGFVDGNKRIAYMALEAFLRMNDFKIHSNVDDQERMILGVAAGTITRDQFTAWVQSHASPIQ